MKLFYDLHIHTALSPCGDNDMTPNNVVNMSIIKGLDMIAVTDHNTCGNAEALIKVAGDNLLVIPGMEIETAEEIHVVSYFPDLDSAKMAEEEVKAHLPKIKNQTHIYGNQYYMDENDEILGEEENLLVTATNLSFNEAFELVRKYGGVPVPAHIDRSSYSVLSNIGFIPDDLSIKTLEITPPRRNFLQKDYENYNILSSSDAHYLENISEREFSIDINAKNVKAFLDFLCKKE